MSLISTKLAPTKQYLMNPEKIIQQQVIAYNSRNITDFADCHHPDVELFNFPEKVPFAVGREKIRSIYKEVFDKSPNLHTEVVHRMSLGNTVIDNEIVTGRAGVDSLKIIAIYEIEDELIRRAHFIRED